MRLSEIDLRDKRKLLHTPKSGIMIPEGADFYKEQIEENKYLRNFIDIFNARLAHDIDLFLTKKHSVNLQTHMTQQSPIRQAKFEIGTNQKTYSPKPSMISMPPDTVKVTVEPQPIKKAEKGEHDSEFYSDQSSEEVEGNQPPVVDVGPLEEKS